MKSRDKRLRRQARLARNKVLDEHRDRINDIFYREEAGEAITKGCSVSENWPGPGECLICLEDQRVEAEYREVTRAVDWFCYEGGHRNSLRNKLRLLFLPIQTLPASGPGIITAIP